MLILQPLACELQQEIVHISESTGLLDKPGEACARAPQNGRVRQGYQLPQREPASRSGRTVHDCTRPVFLAKASQNEAPAGG